MQFSPRKLLKTRDHFLFVSRVVILNIIFTNFWMKFVGRNLPKFQRIWQLVVEDMAHIEVILKFTENRNICYDHLISIFSKRIQRDADFSKFNVRSVIKIDEVVLLQCKNHLWYDHMVMAKHKTVRWDDLTSKQMERKCVEIFVGQTLSKFNDFIFERYFLHVCLQTQVNKWSVC